MEHSDRELIFLGSLKGTPEELAHEAFQALLKWREANARHEPFQTVLDLESDG
jgi:hypothetical protein